VRLGPCPSASLPRRLELDSGDLKALKGFALMHKIGPSGPTGEGWFWYESTTAPTNGYTRGRCGAP